MHRVTELRMSVVVALLFVCACEGRRPNLIVITIDTLRADALGVYGNPGGHSPDIDAFAAGAIVFDNAITPMGTTLPSHSSLFTGLAPRRHAVRWNGDVLENRYSTLAEILTADGYETAAFVSLGLLLSHGGLDQGIATTGGLWEGGSGVLSGDRINEKAIPWLESREERPFFLWLHYHEPHTPYRLTPYARDKLAGYQGPLAEGGPVMTVYDIGHGIPSTPEELAALRILYDGEVREADRLVGEVLDALRQQELLSDSVVVVTSDHGQSLGEHGVVGHGNQLTQPVLHVPLLVHSPSHGARRVSSRVGLIDLLPSLLDLLDLPAPEGLDGRTLVPVIEGKRQPGRRYFAEVRATGKMISKLQKKLGDDQEARSYWLARAREADPGAVAVFEDDLKGIWKHGELLFYDLGRDPQELAPGDPEVQAARETALRDLASSYHDGAAVAAARRELDEEVRKQLAALGYVE